MKNKNELLALAISIAAREFEGVMDKGGRPYILHCIAVMEGVKHLGEEAMMVAVLHDVLEDTEVTGQDLISAGFPFETVVLIENVTKGYGEDYMEYVKRAASHPISKAVKLSDLEHNMQASRMIGLREKDFERLRKYHVAYQFLSE